MGVLGKAIGFIRYYLATGTTKGWGAYSKEVEKALPKPKETSKPQAANNPPRSFFDTVDLSKYQTTDKPESAVPENIPPKEPDIIIDETMPPMPKGDIIQPVKRQNPFVSAQPQSKAVEPAKQVQKSSNHLGVPLYGTWPDTYFNEETLTVTIKAIHTTPQLLHACLFLTLILSLFVILPIILFHIDELGAVVDFLASLFGKEYTLPNLFAWMFFAMVGWLGYPFAVYFILRPFFKTSTTVVFTPYDIKFKRFYWWYGLLLYGWFGPFDRLQEHHFYPEEPSELKMFKMFGSKSGEIPFAVQRAAESGRLMMKHPAAVVEIATIYGEDMFVNFANRVEQVDKRMPELIHTYGRR